MVPNRTRREPATLIGYNENTDKTNKAIRPETTNKTDEANKTKETDLVKPGSRVTYNQNPFEQKTKPTPTSIVHSGAKRCAAARSGDH